MWTKCQVPQKPFVSKLIHGQIQPGPVTLISPNSLLSVPLPSYQWCVMRVFHLLSLWHHNGSLQKPAHSHDLPPDASPTLLPSNPVIALRFWLLSSPLSIRNYNDIARVSQETKQTATVIPDISLAAHLEEDYRRAKILEEEVIWIRERNVSNSEDGYF